MANKTNLNYHIVIVTKYRKQILTETMMGYIIEIVKSKLEELHCEIIAIKGDDMNHIHIMVKLKPLQSVSLIVKLIKQYTSYYMWNEYPAYLRKYYWHKNHLWSKGYFCCTVGDASTDTIKKYIENQG